MTEHTDYYEDDIERVGYDRLIKHLETTGEYAMLHGHVRNDDDPPFCMDFDCEVWGAPEDEDD